MKHTKNILKSLLIMVMALSLLAVSCKKDEGGSKPTNPASKTVTGADITAFIKKIDGAALMFSKMTDPKAGAATLTAEDKSYADAKGELDSLKSSPIESVSVAATYPAAKPKPDANSFDLVLTFNTKSGYVFGDMTGYTKEANGGYKLTITITATGGNWQ